MNDDDTRHPGSRWEPAPSGDEADRPDDKAADDAAAGPLDSSAPPAPRRRTLRRTETST